MTGKPCPGCEGRGLVTSTGAGDNMDLDTFPCDECGGLGTLSVSCGACGHALHACICIAGGD